ncbi:MAG: hypothetical protein FDZ70_01830 [Actinobacteria bacterium]|nr:MAG: hypothetical protein FDZ70_01830 [Actinomycetota bacterium]
MSGNGEDRGLSRGVRRVLVRTWNLAWDVGLAGSVVLAMAIIDRFAVHKGPWWVAGTSLVALLAFEVGVRLAWWLLLPLFRRRGPG